MKKFVANSWAFVLKEKHMLLTHRNTKYWGCNCEEYRRRNRLKNWLIFTRFGS